MDAIKDDMDLEEDEPDAPEEEIASALPVQRSPESHHIYPAL